MCARFLSNSTFVGAGCVTGRMFLLDGYPGMVGRTDGSARVVGEVFRLHDPSRDLVLLGEYEGCGPVDPLPHEFERSIMPVQMNDGRALDAWVYLYCLDTSGRAQIPSGDYLEPCSS